MDIIIREMIESDIEECVKFSLSLMGKNYDEYLKEAFRILKPMGRIFICEPLKKWNDRKLEECLENIGYEVYGTTKTDKFIYINGGK